MPRKNAATSAPANRTRQVGRCEQQKERYPDDGYGEHDAEHEEDRQGHDTVHERPSRCFPDPARRRGERTRGEHRGQHGAGGESERREQPADEAEHVRTVGLVEVERHPFRRYVALHGIGVAGELTALVLEVARDLGPGTQVYVSVPHVDVSTDRGVHVDVPELGV